MSNKKKYFIVFLLGFTALSVWYLFLKKVIIRLPLMLKQLLQQYFKELRIGLMSNLKVRMKSM